MKCQELGGLTHRMLLISIPTFVWALRMALHFTTKIMRTGEDYRFLTLRKEWESKGNCLYYVISYFCIFVG